jgi:SAM-dependent methyltransferase
MEPNLSEDWFGTWFSSPYYHILYKNRDEKEAQQFLDNLCVLLNFSSTDRILDLACGKGRHSIYLNQKGYKVDGIDLSEENIRIAKESESEGLRFFVHDMRQPFRLHEYQYVLNMFTSFGYFETMDENYQVIHSVYRSLREGGRFVLDFLNPYRVINHLVSKELKTVNGIEFEIERTYEDQILYKDIRFSDQGKEYHFQERVKAIRRTEFLGYFEKAGLELLNIFGDYNLKEYRREESERMIFLLEKPE